MANKTTDQASKIVMQLFTAGVSLSVVDNGLVIDKPKGLSLNLALIKEHKADIIECLNHRNRAARLRWIGQAHLVIGHEKWTKILDEFKVGDSWDQIGDETLARIQKAMTS